MRPSEVLYIINIVLRVVKKKIILKSKPLSEPGYTNERIQLVSLKIDSAIILADAKLTLYVNELKQVDLDL